MPQSRRKVGRCGGGFEGDMQAGRCVRRKCYEPYELRETVVVRRNGPLASSFLSRETRSMVAVAPTQFSHSGAFKETVLADAGVAAATFLGLPGLLATWFASGFIPWLRICQCVVWYVIWLCIFVISNSGRPPKKVSLSNSVETYTHTTMGQPSRNDSRPLQIDLPPQTVFFWH